MRNTNGKERISRGDISSATLGIVRPGGCAERVWCDDVERRKDYKTLQGGLIEPAALALQRNGKNKFILAVVARVGHISVYISVPSSGVQTLFSDSNYHSATM